MSALNQLTWNYKKIKDIFSEPFDRDTRLAEMPETREPQGLPECSRCNKQFRLNIMLVKHKKECEILTTKDGSWCPLCNKTISNKVFGRKALSIHIVSHPEIEQLIRKMNRGLQPEEIECDTDCDRTGIPTEEKRKFHDFVECKYSLIRLERFILKLLIEEVDKEIEEYTSGEKNKDRDDILLEIPENARPELKEQNQGLKVIKIRKRENDYSIQSTTPVKYARKLSTQERQKKSTSDTITSIERYKSLKCEKCLRCFNNRKQLKDPNDHLCAALAKEGKSIRTQLLEHDASIHKRKLLLGNEKRSVGTEGMVRKCTLCPILNRPTFPSDDDLMKHIILGHEFNVLWKRLNNQGMDVFPIGCLLCKKKSFSKTKLINDLEEALLHVGTNHREYFKSSKFDFKHLFKKFSKGNHKPTSRKEEVEETRRKILRTNSSAYFQHYQKAKHLAPERTNLSAEEESAKDLKSDTSLEQALLDQPEKNASSALIQREPSSLDIHKSAELALATQKEDTSRNSKFRQSRLGSSTYQPESSSSTKIQNLPVFTNHTMNHSPQINRTPISLLTPTTSYHSAFRKYHIPYPLYSLESLTKITSGTQPKHSSNQLKSPVKT